MKKKKLEHCSVIKFFMVPKSFSNQRLQLIENNVPAYFIVTFGVNNFVMFKSQYNKIFKLEESQTRLN